MHSSFVLSLFAALVFAAVAGQGASAQSASAQSGSDDPDTGDRLSFEKLYDAPLPGAWPEQIAWSPQGDRLAYLLPDDGPDATALWTLDPANGKTRKLLSSSALPGGIDAHHFSPAGDRVLIESSGQLFLLAEGGEPEPVAEAEEAAEDPKFAPDGTAIAFVRGADLHLLDLASGRVRALTEDGQPGEILNGKTDWVYGEELWNRDATGFWWRPDGKAIAFYHFDDREVGRFPLIDVQPSYPEVTWQRYPKAGGVNPQVRVGVLELATQGRRKRSPVRWLETEGERESYLARVDWLPGGEALMVQRLDREQNRLELLRCDAATGACTTVLVEEHPTWVNLGDDYRFLADGRFIWGSDRNGWRHLYLYAADGTLIRQLTDGRLAVTSLDEVDEAAGRVTFTGWAGPGFGSLRRTVYQVSLDGGSPRPLTGAESWNQALPAPGNERWLHTSSTGDRPPVHTVRNGDGEAVAELPAGPEPAFDPEALPQWEYLTIWALKEGRLPARILKPADFDPERRYPVIMYHYGGPGSQVVADRWGSRGRDLWHKMMAQRGYVVLSVDNAATAHFAKAGEDLAHRLFGPTNVEAQLAAIDFLATQPYVDIDRVGLWGWSGGGTHTLMALAASPGTWKAAVAGAPVTDWRLYDTIWTERYLDHPEANPDGYRDSSPVTHAARIADPLLIVHGTGDDNVHAQNTLVMSQALIEAGRPFEQAIYPGVKHAIAGAAARHFYERMTAFFDRYLEP